ncbi:AAA family ATPase [Pseudohongiella sp.]|uniref:Cell division protein ZipA n=1 Tax=marine sediment metagenome TaxID=412755 RepID=A0A0F9YFH0_9ZZZZ|nr:ATP-binding protein [Pseudohongiella sp.]HDZ08273.1 ATP-binding protein [Pseudohongiella sp.]HEA62549.1 ATP-binding protein [Pseudohongiella sp.]
MSKGVLIFFCGKMGAGKSTKSREIAQKRNAVFISEDEWLASLYPNSILSLDDYIQCSDRLKLQMKRLVQSILISGTDVVMDFPANTIPQREWFRSIFSEVRAPHELIYIDQPNDVCISQIEKRRTEHPQRAATDTKEMFELVTKHFVVPTSDEGFNTTVVVGNAQQALAD